MLDSTSPCLSLRQCKKNERQHREKPHKHSQPLVVIAVLLACPHLVQVLAPLSMLHCCVCSFSDCSTNISYSPFSRLSFESLCHENQVTRSGIVFSCRKFHLQLRVQENYRNNPFHNFRHCFCVAQMMYGVIHLCALDQCMSREDLGVLMTAAICHDLDHPGYNNA